MQTRQLKSYRNRRKQAKNGEIYYGVKGSLKTILNGCVAQSVEQLPVKQWVVGSSPTASASDPMLPMEKH